MTDERVEGEPLENYAAREFGRIEEQFKNVRADLRELRERFDQVDARFDQVDARFDQVDARFDQVEGRLGKVEGRLDRVEWRLEHIETRFDKRFDDVVAEIRTQGDRTRAVLEIHEGRIAALEAGAGARRGRRS